MAVVTVSEAERTLTDKQAITEYLVACGIDYEQWLLDHPVPENASAEEILRTYSKEIDALRTMNINPIHYLVLPRMVAITVALPLLVIFAILVGWLGGACVAAFNNRIEVSFGTFLNTLRNAVELKDVANGVFKTFVFALVIGIVSCHQGLITRGGPRGIGRSVTKAVVNSIVLIVIFDYILTRLLLK